MADQQFGIAAIKQSIDDFIEVFEAIYQSSEIEIKLLSMIKILSTYQLTHTINIPDKSKNFIIKKPKIKYLYFCILADCLELYRTRQVDTNRSCLYLYQDLVVPPKYDVNNTYKIAYCTFQKTLQRIFNLLEIPKDLFIINGTLIIYGNLKIHINNSPDAPCIFNSDINGQICELNVTKDMVPKTQCQHGMLIETKSGVSKHKQRGMNLDRLLILCYNGTLTKRICNFAHWLSALTGKRFYLCSDSDFYGLKALKTANYDNDPICKQYIVNHIYRVGITQSQINRDKPIRRNATNKEYEALDEFKNTITNDDIYIDREELELIAERNWFITNISNCESIGVNIVCDIDFLASKIISPVMNAIKFNEYFNQLNIDETDNDDNESDDDSDTDEEDQF